jgi:tripartite-type tricarboxylate transporter receptor subunit TctC
MRLGLRLISAIAFAAVLASAASAQEPFYKGKTIRIITSVGVAGGFGEYVRIVGEHLARHIAGQPNVIVQAMPGAGGLVATNFLYNQAPQDGTTIGIVNSTLALSPLMGNRNARYDAMKFHWIGAMDRAEGSCTFWHEAGIKSIADMKDKQPTVGSMGSGSPMEIYALLLNRLLGVRIKVVGGYKAGSDIDLAMMRGEVEGRCGTHLDTIRVVHPDWMNGPKFTMPVIVADRRRPDFPDTPAIIDLVTDEARRNELRLFMVPQDMHRPVLAPPDVPAARVTELRTAFIAAVDDPQFKADLVKRAMQANPTPGDRVARMISDAYAMPPDVVAAVRDIVGQK